MAAGKCLLLCTLLVMGTVVTPAFAARAHLRDAEKAGLRGRELLADATLTVDGVTDIRADIALATKLINNALSPKALSVSAGRKLSQAPQLGSLGVVGPLLLGIVNPLLVGVDNLLGGLLTALGGGGPTSKVCAPCGILNGLDLQNALSPILDKVNDLLGTTLSTVIGPNKVLTVAINSLSNPSLLGNLINGLLSGPLRAGANNPDVSEVNPAEIPEPSVNELTGAIVILKSVLSKLDGALGGCGPLPTTLNQLLTLVINLLDGLLGGLLIGLLGTTLGPALNAILGTLGGGNCPAVVG